MRVCVKVIERTSTTNKRTEPAASRQAKTPLDTAATRGRHPKQERNYKATSTNKKRAKTVLGDECARATPHMHTGLEAKGPP